MECRELALEYAKLLLSGPPVFALTAVALIWYFNEEMRALLTRVARITLPGGAQIDTPQSKPPNPEEKPLKTEEVEASEVPTGLTPDQEAAFTEALNTQKITATLWEYRYLNYFLARGTQILLDWLIGSTQPITCTYYDSFFLPIVPSAHERQAMLGALESHRLIAVDRKSSLITVTAKGQDYHEWRGTLPAATNKSMGAG